MIKNVENRQKILVLGYGVSGRSMTRFFQKNQAAVTVVDRCIPTEQEENVTYLIEDQPIDITHYSLFVPSPGIPRTHPLYLQARKKNVPIAGEIEIACRQRIHQKKIAITGTNGKTTVTLLITHMLNRSGVLAQSTGNVGLPLIDSDEEGVLVTELSSFQLETVSTKGFHHGALLNISPDHLDRYADFKEYAKTKISLFSLIDEGGTALLPAHGKNIWKTWLPKRKYATFGKNQKNTFSTDGCFLYEYGEKREALPKVLQGKYSYHTENFLAAYGMCRAFAVSPKEIIASYATFTHPRHRMEYVGEMNGVTFFNDSKGTNEDAVVKAVELLEKNIILLVGGQEKGETMPPGKTHSKKSETTHLFRRCRTTDRPSF